MTTSALRQQLRHQRQQLPPPQRALLSRQATTHAQQLLSQLQVKRIATFLSMDEEIDTRYLNLALFDANKTLYLPYVKQKNAALYWVQYLAESRLSVDEVGITAPIYDHTHVQSAQTFDAVIAPLVGFDSMGNRLGMGGGYYDRSFAFKARGEKPYLLGFAYDFQQVATLPTATWDVPLDGVITNQDVVLFNINQ